MRCLKVALNASRLSQSVVRSRLVSALVFQIMRLGIAATRIAALIMRVTPTSVMIAAQRTNHVVNATHLGVSSRSVRIR